MDNKQKIAFLESNLSRQISLVNIADLKVRFVMTIDTAMLGTLCAFAPQAGDLFGWQAVFMGVTLVLLLTSLLMISLAAFPRVRGSQETLLFPRGIVDRSFEEYRKQVEALEPDGYVLDLTRQCHINGGIVLQKFRWIKHAMLAMYLSILPWALSIFAAYGAD